MSITFGFNVFLGRKDLRVQDQDLTGAMLWRRMTGVRAKADIIKGLLNPGVIAIVRTDRPEPILNICGALLAGGVRAIEITLTVPGALTAIRQARDQFGSRIVLGVGTEWGQSVHLCSL